MTKLNWTPWLVVLFLNFLTGFALAGEGEIGLHLVCKQQGSSCVTLPDLSGQNAGKQVQETPGMTIGKRDVDEVFLTKEDNGRMTLAFILQNLTSDKLEKLTLENQGQKFAVVIGQRIHEVQDIDAPIINGSFSFSPAVSTDASYGVKDLSQDLPWLQEQVSKTSFESKLQGNMKIAMYIWFGLLLVIGLILAVVRKCRKKSPLKLDAS